MTIVNLDKLVRIPMSWFKKDFQSLVLLLCIDRNIVPGLQIRCKLVSGRLIDVLTLSVSRDTV